MISLSTYPATLFDGSVKIILFTLVPAGFINYFPIQALRTLSLPDALCVLAGSLAVLGCGVIAFYWGLRRYESGNLTEMRG